jgi:hypothetical protein
MDPESTKKYSKVDACDFVWSFGCVPAPAFVFLRYSWLHLLITISYLIIPLLGSHVFPEYKSNLLAKAVKIRTCFLIIG